MSFGYSPALQTAVFTTLSNDATLDGLVGGAIFDLAPGGTVPSLFVALGPEKVTRAADGSAEGAEHLFEINVVSSVDGYFAIKEIGARISDLLHGAPLTLSLGHLVSLRFVNAEALHNTSDDTRRVRMWFRARIDAELPV